MSEADRFKELQREWDKGVAHEPPDAIIGDPEEEARRIWRLSGVVAVFVVLLVVAAAVLWFIRR